MNKTMLSLHWKCIRMAQQLDRPGYPLRARIFDTLAGVFARLA